jgi:hypothetical protein
MTMFSLTEDAKGKSLAIFYADGESETIPEAHVSFKPIIEKLISGSATDEDIRDLTGVLKTVARKMSALSERVSIDGKEVYFDGDPLRGEISDIIKRMFEEGKALDFKPLVNFLEKAKTNPSLKSIDDLYRWIRNGDLVIDPDGDIVAYKAVRVNAKGENESIHAGSAFVNGEEVQGFIPNIPGSVVSMARSQVNDNEFETCSYGLHAGTYAYANQFAGWQGGETTRLILVKINPRDVVSVPNDHNDAKMRVARYTVLTQIEERINEPFYQPTLDVDDDDDLEDYEEDDFYEDDDEQFEEAAWEDLANWEKAILDSARYEAELVALADAEDEAKAKAEAEAAEEEPEEEQSQTDAIRDALGRFTQAAGKLMKRDSSGRFVS